MNCSICNLPTGNVVGSVLPQCMCGWQKPNPPVIPQPSQKPWVGLTDEEIQSIFIANSVMVDNGNAFMVGGLRAVNISEAIETKLKELNT